MESWKGNETRKWERRKEKANTKIEGNKLR
jgi:hypothetical protein